MRHGCSEAAFDATKSSSWVSGGANRREQSRTRPAVDRDVTDSHVREADVCYRQSVVDKKLSTGSGLLLRVRGHTTRPSDKKVNPWKA